MASVELREVTKLYGSLRAVDRLSLRVERGELVALLGPSGCGKTTTLHLLAGFLQPDAGQILFDDQTVERVPPHKRNTGMVFQSYALFPHLTVAENIAFGLEMRKMPRVDIGDRVQRVLDLVQMPGLEDRYPRQLSGGQQQRVALARALVIQPAVLLLDEPLSNLDAKLRQEMRVELVEIQRRVGITTIFVTHDQEEALAIARRLAVMNGGIVEQVGTPRDLYERPRTAFVARFIGESNTFEAVVRSHRGAETLAQTAHGLTVVSTCQHSCREGERVLVVVRPERMRLREAATQPTNSLTGHLDAVTYLGAVTHYRLATPEGKVLVWLQQSEDGHRVEVGATAAVEWEPRDALLLPSPADGT